MRNPHRIIPDIRDFNALSWFCNDEVANPTYVLAGDHVDKMVSVLVRSHLGNGDIPIIAGDLDGDYAEFTRAVGGSVITVTDNPSEQLPADALSARMICLDMSALSSADIDTIRAGLAQTLDQLAALFTEMEARRAEHDSTAVVNEPHYAVFLDGTLAAPPADEDLYRRLDEASRLFPLMTSCYLCVDVARVPEGHFSNVQGVYATGIIERAGRIICGTTSEDNAPRLQQTLGLTDREVDLVTNPRTPDQSAGRVGRMPYQYLMTDARDRHDLVTDRVGIDTDGAVVRETTTVVEYGASYEPRPGFDTQARLPDGTVLPIGNPPREYAMTTGDKE